MHLVPSLPLVVLLQLCSLHFVQSYVTTDDCLTPLLMCPYPVTNNNRRGRRAQATPNSERSLPNLGPHSINSDPITINAGDNEYAASTALFPTSSWCSAANPFIVARPPTGLYDNANYSTRAPLPAVSSVKSVSSQSYIPAYYCGGPSSNGSSTDPFATCQYIDAFAAFEAPGYANSSVRIVVVAERMVDSSLVSGDEHAVDEHGRQIRDNYNTANSILSIYDTNFNLLMQPVVGFPGRLSILVPLANPQTDGQTSFVAYGGNVPSIPDAPAYPDCGRGCFTVLFTEMDLTTVPGNAFVVNQTFTGEGGWAWPST
jgi:hypothetical protein